MAQGGRWCHPPAPAGPSQVVSSWFWNISREGNSVPVPGHCTVRNSSSEEKWDSLRQKNAFPPVQGFIPKDPPCPSGKLPNLTLCAPGEDFVLLKELFLLFRRVDSKERFEHSALGVVKISN